MRAKYVLSEVFLGLWRNVTMTVAMIITMAVSLALLGAGVLMYWKVQDMRTFFYGSVEVSIFLKPDITDSQQAALKDQLAQDPLVKETNYESKGTAYKRFQEQFKDAKDLVNSVKPDSLPASFRVKLKDPKQFDQIAATYRGKDGVDDVLDQQRLLAKVFGVLGAAQNMALAVAIIQGIAALLLVGNTIQVAAYSRRREVAVMKLVGASNWFIQSPFVLEAMFAGIIGAILASVGLVAAKFWLIDGTLKPLTSLLTPVGWSRILWMAPILIGIGAVVSGVTGWVTLRFYIKK
jgi:cell division transport system permease protein